MATTTTVHAQLIRYTTAGDQVIIDLKTTAADVSVDRSTNTKLPSTVTTAQTLANALGSLAFKDTIADASTSASGLMTAAMVTKLNGIASGANAYSHPTYTSRAAGFYKVTVDSTGHVSAVSAVTKGDITGLGIPGQDTTYSAFSKATADTAGGTGLVPAPAKGQQGLYLRGDGTWATPTNTVYTHPNSGAAAGTYRSVTVNAQGHVTAGSNPTTLAGYGITDAVSSSDSRLTNSRPASDVYAWAKAASKPSYTKSEVGLGNVDNTADANKSVKYAGSAGSAGQISISEISSSDLNSLTTEGKFYFAGGSNTCKNGPVAAGTAFELYVGRNASGYRYQRFITLEGEIYIRIYDSTSWGNWRKLAFTSDTVDVAKSANSVAWGNVSGKPSTYPADTHTHNYAGSSSAGGSANSAVKLDTATAGSATQPVYFTGGKPAACTYTLGKSVPSNAVFTDTVYTHPNSGVTAGTYRSVTVNAAGHVTGGSNPTTLSGYGITDAAAKSHTHTASQITDSIPASKISGVLSIDNIPKSAIERVVPVTDDTARLKLTTSDVQNGDVVKVTATGKMYFVVDETKLTSEDGYMIFTAGSAASVPWSGVTGKPSSMPASDVYAWAKASTKPSYSKSEVGLGNVDNTADSAKSVKYATSAGSAGSSTKATQDSAGQQINTTYIKGLSVNGKTITYTRGDNTTGTITTQDTNTTYSVFAKATADAAGGTGLVPAPAKGQQGQYLRGDGTWATPTNTTYGVFKGATGSAAGGTGLVPAPGTGNTGQYLRGDGSWATPPNTTYADATTSAHGLMTAAMVSKLNGIASGANAYSHPGYTARSSGLYKITVDSTGHVSAVTAVTKADITGLGIPGQDTNTTYSVFAKATADAAGGTGLVPAPAKGQQGQYLRGDGTWATPTDTNTWRPLGTGASDACAGNDSRLSNARPASDVYAWAKASTKPSYSKSEVGLGNVDNTADSAKSVKYATSAGSASSATTAGTCTGNSATATKASTVAGTYTGNGGVQYPSYIGGGIVRFNMMNNSINGDTSYKDFILMDTYTGSDVPYVTAIGVSKSGSARAFIMSGAKGNTTTWASTAELLSTNNYTSYTVTKGGSGASGTWGINVTGSSGSCTGNAATASNASKVNGHTVNADVPSGAKFTDTNTWRGIQDNLTSTSTSDSLSANQGRVLKGLVDGKAASSHGHSTATSSANGFMSSTDKAKLDFGDIVYVSKSTPSKQCLWIKLDA